MGPRIKTTKKRQDYGLAHNANHHNGFTTSVQHQLQLPSQSKLLSQQVQQESRPPEYQQPHSQSPSQSAGQTSQQASQAQQQLQLQVKLQSQPKSQPQPQSQSQSQSQTQSQPSQPQSQSPRQTGVQSQPQLQLSSQSQSQLNSQPQSQIQIQTQSQTQLNSQPQSQTQSRISPTSQPQPQHQSKLHFHPQPKLLLQSNTKVSDKTSNDMTQQSVGEKTTPSPVTPATNRCHTMGPSQGSNHKETYYCYKANPAASTFSWETYLQLRPAKVAPKEAFRQAKVLPKNLFTVGMKLEAKDPRNSSNWCLATVIYIEGLHLRVRFVGADAMNDLYEIIDSENIRPVGSCPSDLLLAPTGFTGNIAQYPKYVEKVLRDESTIIAPPECFPPTPQKPERNLFEKGMKLEAVDLKNRDFICPATIGAVRGNEIHIMFDGWRGSFDYKCDYASRDIFPVNWCRDAGRAIQPPNGWQNLLDGGTIPAWSPPSTPSISPTKPSPTKKPRGRPRKDVSKESNKASKEHQRNSKDSVNRHKTNREKPNSSKPISSTPKVQSQLHQNPEAEPFSMPISPQTSEDLTNLNRFQCQRTISYDEWQKRKLEEQMPRAELIDDSKDMGNGGLNLSDTTSMASTLSSSNQRDSTESFEQGSCRKKVKTDASDVSEDLTDIPTNLRGLLETKPTKLTQWTVQDVLDVLGTESSLTKYLDTFQENEIDGKAFGLFDEKKRDLLMSMGLKLGPVLKVLHLREQVAYCLNERNDKI